MTGALVSTDTVWSRWTSAIGGFPLPPGYSMMESTLAWPRAPCANLCRVRREGDEATALYGREEGWNHHIHPTGIKEDERGTSKIGVFGITGERRYTELVLDL